MKQCYQCLGSGCPACIGTGYQVAGLIAEYAEEEGAENLSVSTFYDLPVTEQRKVREFIRSRVFEAPPDKRSK